MRHSALFLVTLVSTTFAGIVISAPEIEVPEPPLSGLLTYLFYIPDYYLRIVAALTAFTIAQSHNSF